MNERFQNALRRIPQATPPVWFMRQAGRYHRHYQALREKHSFEDLCRVPELACEVALGPVQDFDFDVAILFSDLLFPLSALGLNLSYESGGPQITTPLSVESISKLRPVDEAVADLYFQRDAMRLTREKLPKSKSLIGFVGGPATLFAYATGAEKAERLIAAKRALPLFENFAEFLTPLLEANIRLQLEGGAEVVMIFDTFAGNFPVFQFQSLFAPQLEKLVSAFPGKVGYYSRGITEDYLGSEAFTDYHWAGFGYDHRFDIRSALERGMRGFVQGNFDESLLHLEGQGFKNVVEQYLSNVATLSVNERAGWVCGLGHGVTPGTPEDNVRYFINRVREVFQ